MPVSISNRQDALEEDAAGVERARSFAKEQISLLRQAISFETEGPFASASTIEAETIDRGANQNDESENLREIRSSRQTTRHTRRCYTVKEGWILEILSWALGAASIAAIVTVLRIYDQESLPQWPYNITLSTFVSTFSTIAKAALLYVVAQALGQLKWSWYYRDSAPLADFDTFDSASRGAIGSFQLLGLMKGRRLASLGALITIVAVATTPFTQQVITYPERIVVAGNATLPRAFNYTAPSESEEDTTRYDLISIQLQHSMYQALFTSDQIVSPLAPSCSTGNCSWPEYQSFGTCSESENITSQVQLANCSISNCTYVLGCGPGPCPLGNEITLNMTFEGYTSSEVMAFITYPSLKNEIWPYLTTRIVYWDPILQSVEAMQFSLQICIQSYKTTVVNGKPSNVIMETWNYENWTYGYPTAENNDIPVLDDNARWNISIPGDNNTHFLDDPFIELFAFTVTFPRFGILQQTI